VSHAGIKKKKDLGYKIAIVHDWLVVRGGAERVLERLLYLFPKADLYCLFGNKSSYQEPIFPSRQFKTSFLQNVPFFQQWYRYGASVMPIAIESLRLESYDVIISSSWAFAHGINKTEKTKHLAYVHSPMRWAWDMEDEYLSRSKIPKIAINLVKKQLNGLRNWDVKAGQKPDVIISNSDFVGERIKKNWGRESNTIYPPVIAKQISKKTKKHGAYISISRLVPYKRIDNIIEAFRLLPEKKLIIAGEGPDREELEKNAPSNISFVGFLPDYKKIELLVGARAMIQASKEDFGISVVEAQTLGIPVIAYIEGGASEIINNVQNKNPTGFLFDDIDPRKIAESINLFEKYEFSSQDCKLKAKKFSFEVFDDKITTALENLME
jgi:glycosyltransferase involved in cell wall biosynthesis